MNVATAIRYGLNGFVTRDGALLRRRDAIADAFNAFTILSPEHAMSLADRMAVRWRARQED